MSVYTQFKAGSQDFITIQERFCQQDRTFIRDRFLGINQSGLITTINAIETFLYLLFQLIQNRLILSGIETFQLFHIIESQTDRLHIQPTQVALQITDTLSFLIKFQILTDLSIDIFFRLDLLNSVLYIRGVFQTRSHIQNHITLSGSVTGGQPILQPIDISV